MQKSMREKISTYYNKFGIFVILIALMVVCSILSPKFLTHNNIKNVLRQLAVVVILACGMQHLLIAGMIDLSAGSMIALSGCFGVSVYVHTLNMALAIGTSMITGAVAGILIGLVITRFNIPPFIATLAMNTAAQGGALLFTNGRPISGIGKLAVLGQGYVGTIPIPIIIMFACIVIDWIVLTKTRYGRYLYAIGGNQEASVACGINAKRIRVVAYIISGFFAGLAGITMMARVNSGQPTVGPGYEFDAITAVVVGGTSMSGGSGSIWGTFVGGLIVCIINNILNLKNVSSYYQQIVSGLIILLAVLIDTLTKGGKRD